MSRLNRLGSLFLLTAIALSSSTGCAPPQSTAQEGPPRVILFIADGTGTSYWTGAAFARDDLAMKRFSVMGLVDTRSSDSKITDSAAAATAYSAGLRTYNGAIGVDPDTASVPTILEMARERGMATGLVATSSITHATPAAFASHVPDRAMQWEIARQLADAGVDVVLAGGRNYFDAAHRPDSLDLLSGIRLDHHYVETPEELALTETETISALWGLFADQHLPAAAERAPTLPQMTRAALRVLDRNPAGFFLMVEASQPDWVGHDHEPLEMVVAEVLDLDDAVAVALEYQAQHPETLIVVTADHETGGLAIEQARSEDGPLVLVSDYTSTGHTAQMVPLFASGPGAEAFGGIKDNWRIGELLREAVLR